MTTTATTVNGVGGWGRFIWFPIAAVVIGLAGGFGVGRALRPAPPADGELPPEAEKLLPKGMRQAAAAQKAAAEALQPDPTRPVPTVNVHLRSTPPGAQVTIDGKMYGLTPWDGVLPESDRPASLMLWKKGFVPKEERFVPKGEVVLQYELVAMVPPRANAKRKPIGVGGRGRGAKRIGAPTTIDPFN